MHLSSGSRKLGAAFELRDPEQGGEEERPIQAVCTRLGHDWSLLCESVDDVPRLAKSAAAAVKSARHGESQASSGCHSPCWGRIAVRGDP